MPQSTTEPPRQLVLLWRSSRVALLISSSAANKMQIPSSVPAMASWHPVRTLQPDGPIRKGGFVKIQVNVRGNRPRSRASSLIDVHAKCCFKVCAPSRILPPRVEQNCTPIDDAGSVFIRLYDADIDAKPLRSNLNGCLVNPSSAGFSIPGGFSVP